MCPWLHKRAKHQRVTRQDPVFSAGREEMREVVEEGGNKVSENATRRAEEIICPPGRQCAFY